jgi:hypothetical protein
MGLGFDDGFAPKEGFWEHVCPVHGGKIGFEKGVECDWCGAVEETTKKLLDIYPRFDIMFT